MEKQLTINLDAIQNAINLVKSTLTNKCKICAIVKANAYGIGLDELTRPNQLYNIDYYGITSFEEARTIRNHDPHTAILLLYEPLKSDDDLRPFIDLTITPTIYSISFAKKLNEMCASLGIPLPVHIKINTGMNRFGSSIESGQTLYKFVHTECSHLICEGLFTHLANSDDKTSNYTQYQMDQFNQFLNSIPVKNHLIHAANSGGIKHHPSTHFNMVRPGVLLYENAVSLTTKILKTQRVEKGDYIGYGNEGKASKPCKIGVIGLGYADGLPMNSMYSEVLINGKRYPFIGKICMDYSMIDLGEPSVPIEIGHDVTIIGENNGESISLQEFCNTTKEPIRKFLCGLSNRIPRKWILRNIELKNEPLKLNNIKQLEIKIN